MKEIKRYIQEQVLKDLNKKMVLVAGPRQCGKTTMALSLSDSIEYLNYDNLDDRSFILQRKWDRKKQIIFFDELHKMPNWKSWLKGIYDKEKSDYSILVTGSARLNTLRKVGDSLAGRYYYFRLHPFDLKELAKSNLKMSKNDIFNRLMEVGGYPEPFMNGSEAEYRRWRQTHMDIILRHDLSDLEYVRDLRSLEILVELLRNKVGSTISINSLATDLQKDHKTVQRWLRILEDLFIIFKVLPYSKDISRAVKKEPKYYFYDTGFVNGDDSQKLENLVACALLKEVHFLSDIMGKFYQIYFLKIKGGREIDFLIWPDDKKHSSLMLEVKLSNDQVSPNFKIFSSHFPKTKKIQLVKNLQKEYVSEDRIEVRKAVDWLSDFEI